MPEILTRFDPRRNWDKILALILVIALFLFVAFLPIMDYPKDGMQQVWIWGWSDETLSYWKTWWDFPPSSAYMAYNYHTRKYYFTDNFYPSAISAIILGAIAFLIYIVLAFCLALGKKKNVKIYVRVATGWTWLWAIGLVIASIIISIAAPNTTIACVAAIALSFLCLLMKPSVQEKEILTARLTRVKMSCGEFFAHGKKNDVFSDIVEIIDAALEIGSNNICRDAQEYQKILPKL